MQLLYSIRREEYIRAVEATVGSLLKSDAHAAFERRRKMVVLARDLCWLLALGALLWIYPDAARPLLILAAVSILVVTLAEWAAARLPTALGTTFDPLRHEELRAEFGPEEVTLAGREHRQVWRRSMLRRIHELPGIYVLEFAGSDMMVVPKRAFASPQDEARWTGEMRRDLPAG